MHERSQLLGIGWMIFHCLIVSVLSTMIRGIADEYHIFQIVFFHNAFAFLFLLPWAFKQGIQKTAQTQAMELHVSRALLGIISLVLYFYAFTVIPLTEARAIALTGPLVSSLFAVLFFKEKVGWHRSSALTIGFLAALWIVAPGTDNFSFVSLYVLIAVCMWSVIDIIIKILSKTESSTTQLFYLMGLMTLFSIPTVIPVWKTPEDLTQWLWLACIGAIFLLNSFAVFNAVKHADITAIMPFDFMGMVFISLLAWFFFGEIIDLRTAIGSFVIVASSVYIVKREIIKKGVASSVPPLHSEE